MINATLQFLSSALSAADPSLVDAAATSMQDPGKEPWRHWLLPVQASTFADGHDGLFIFVEWTCYVFFVGIIAALIWSVFKYRRKSEDQEPASTCTHHTTIEVIWTVVPLIIVMVIFAWGWKDMSNMLLAPADSLQYEVRGKRWQWDMKHPGSDEWSTNEFWVPVNEPCQLTMSSADVLHSFFVPAFRVKRDVLPGRYQTLWFEATLEGRYRYFCTEYCGRSHSAMHGWVNVVSREEFDKAPWDVWPDKIEDRGQKVYSQNCKSCHNTNAITLQGPGFQGLYQRTVDRLAKDKTPEEQEKAYVAYVMESIRNPQAYQVPGITEMMAPYPEEMLSDEKVEWVTAFLKTLK